MRGLRRNVWIVIVYIIFWIASIALINSLVLIALWGIPIIFSINFEAGIMMTFLIISAIIALSIALAVILTRWVGEERRKSNNKKGGSQ